MFSHKHLKDFKKNSNRAVNGLSKPSFVYTLIKLNAFFLCQSEKLKIITDFQINCNGHLIKSQSSNNYLSIDIDHNWSGERAPLLERWILVWDISIKKQIVYLLKQEKLEVWHLYNVILIISVPFGMLVYLKFWNTNYKWHKTKQCVLL